MKSMVAGLTLFPKREAKRNTIWILVSLVFTVLLFVTHESIEAQIQPEIDGKTLQSFLDEKGANKYVGTGGVTIAVILPGQDIWVGAKGFSHPDDKTLMHPDNLLRIASITKTFVATTTILLAEEGKLKLEDSIEQWLPGVVPNGENITIRHLLSHTSGLFDLTGFLFGEAAKDPNRVLDPKDLVAMATAKPPAFAPGENYAYCRAC